MQIFNLEYSHSSSTYLILPLILNSQIHFFMFDLKIINVKKKYVYFLSYNKYLVALIFFVTITFFGIQLGQTKMGFPDIFYG